MEIYIRRNTMRSRWEKIDDAPPHDRDIAKRILWQPEGVESSLGYWWYLADNSYSIKRVLLTEGE